MKLVVALVLGGVEFLLALGIFIYLFRESTWSRFYGVEKIVNLVIKQDIKSDDLTRQS